jgi:SAM-dependent methyltransferase
MAARKILQEQNMPTSFRLSLALALLGYCTAWMTTTNWCPISSTVLAPLNALEYDDSEARSQFGTKEYWDELYVGRGDFPSDEYSWYYDWEGYGKYVKEYIPDKVSRILIPGIGNDSILSDLLQNGYEQLTGIDYSDHAIERQIDLISYQYSDDVAELQSMDARQMDPDWTDQFTAVIEKGAFDAIYLSGDGNLELTVKEIERVLKQGGVLISVSGVVPPELRRELFKDWKWLRDGTDDLQAGCFVLTR